MKKFFYLLFIPVFTSAQTNYAELLDSFMVAEMTVKKFNGNVLVAKDGRVVYKRAFGVRNYETMEMLDNNSVFELASVSKQFTAAGILLLQEKKLLSLNDSLRKFFPELPYYNITLRHMLTHTSGLPSYETTMMHKWDRKNIASNQDMIGFLAKEKPPVHFAPGAKWEYSNTAFVLLASIIEKVSGQTFKDYMAENIFKPLGMQQTRIYNTRRSGETIPNYAYGHVYAAGFKKYMLPDSLPFYYDYVIYLDSIQGDGAVNSTTNDLLKWDRTLKNNSLLNKQSQDAMLSAQSVMDTASKRYYGYGVMLGENEIGSYITHSGGWPGYITDMIRYVHEDIVVIVLSNNESKSSMISGALSYIMTDRPIVYPYVHKPITIDTALLDKYIGKYSMENRNTNVVINLYKKSGKLFYQEESGKPVELLPESSNKFFARDIDLQIEFELSATGNVKKIFFIFSSIKKQMKKL